MWPDRVSNPGPLTYESAALPIALRGPAPRYNKEISGDKQRQWHPLALFVTTDLLVIFCVGFVESFN